MRSTIQYNAVQCTAWQYSAVSVKAQCSSVQNSAVQYNAVQCSPDQHVHGTAVSHNTKNEDSVTPDVTKTKTNHIKTK